MDDCKPEAVDVSRRAVIGTSSVAAWYRCCRGSEALIRVAADQAQRRAVEGLPGPARINRVIRNPIRRTAPRRPLAGLRLVAADQSESSRRQPPWVARTNCPTL